MSDLVKLMSSNPARLFGIYPQKGSLKEGSDADITLFDPEAGRVLEDSNVHTKANYTPYRGFEVKGEVKTTILRGRVIMENGLSFTEEGQGHFIRQK